MATAGDLRNRVTVSSIITSPNPDGSFVRTPAPGGVEVPAAINPSRGRLFWQAKEMYSEVDSEIVIRYSSQVADIKPKTQVLFGSRVFSVIYVLNPGETNEYLHLFSKEIRG